MGRSRYKIIERAPHFVTCTTVSWLALFSSKATAGILFDSMKFLQGIGRINIYAYVVLENHLHMILSSQYLSKEIGIFKSYTARNYAGMECVLDIMRFV